MPAKKFPSHKEQRLNNLNLYFDAFTSKIPKDLSGMIKTQSSDLYNDMYDVASQADHMSGKVIPAALSQWVTQTIKKMHSKASVLIPYIMNGIYAAHLDAKENIMKMSQLTGTAYLLRDIAQAYPNESYDPLIVADMMNELSSMESHNRYPMIGLGQALNAYAKAGKIDPKEVAELYGRLEDGSEKINIMTDLAESVPETANRLYYDAVYKNNDNNVQDVDIDSLGDIYQIAHFANDDDEKEKILTRSMSLMDEKVDGNTYQRQRATRQMLKVLPLASEGETLNTIAGRIIDISKRSLTDAANKTPANENQALADYMEVLEVLADRTPHYAETIETVATDAFALANKELSQPGHDWNWGLVTGPAAKAENKAAVVQGKAPKTKTANDYFETGNDLFTQEDREADLLNLLFKGPPRN